MNTKKIQWEVKDLITEAKETNEKDMFGNNKITLTTIGHTWEKLERVYDDELLEILKEEEKKGNCRNIVVVEKDYYDMTKKELLVAIDSAPVHYRPRWKNRATKDELIGWLQTYQELKQKGEVQ